MEKATPAIVAQQCKLSRACWASIALDPSETQKNLKRFKAVLFHEIALSHIGACFNTTCDASIPELATHGFGSASQRALSQVAMVGATVSYVVGRLNSLCCQ